MKRISFDEKTIGGTHNGFEEIGVAPFVAHHEVRQPDVIVERSVARKIFTGEDGIQFLRATRVITQAKTGVRKNGKQIHFPAKRKMVFPGEGKFIQERLWWSDVRMSKCAAVQGYFKSKI